MYVYLLHMYIYIYWYEFIYLPTRIHIVYIHGYFSAIWVLKKSFNKASSSVASFRICDLAIEGWKWMGNGGNTWHFVPYFHRLVSSWNDIHHSERIDGGFLPLPKGGLVCKGPWLNQDWWEWLAIDPFQVLYSEVVFFSPKNPEIMKSHETLHIFISISDVGNNAWNSVAFGPAVCCFPKRCLLPSSMRQRWWGGDTINGLLPWSLK